MKTGKELYEIWARGHVNSTPCLWEEASNTWHQRFHHLAACLNMPGATDGPFAETDLLDARVTALENNDLLESRVRALEEIVTKYRPSHEEVQRMIDTVPLKVGDRVLFNWMSVRTKGTIGDFPNAGWVTVDGHKDYTGYTFRIDDPVYNLRRA